MLVIAILLLIIYRHFGLMVLGSLEGVQHDGLQIGERAPSIDGLTVDRIAMHWEPPPTQATLLLFASAYCEPCANVLPIVSELAKLGTHSSNLEVAVIVPSAREEAQAVVERFTPAFAVIAEGERSAFDDYRVRVTPFAFIIGAGGKVLAKGLCSDRARLEELLSTAGFEGVARTLKSMLGNSAGVRGPELRGSKERIST